jgi:hypothetical protein
MSPTIASPASDSNDDDDDDGGSIRTLQIEGYAHNNAHDKRA